MVRSFRVKNSKCILLRSIVSLAVKVTISPVLVVLMPVYSKLIKKINTTVALEENSDMGQIDIQD